MLELRFSDVSLMFRLIISLYILSGVNGNNDDGKLIFTQIIFRHGDRNPLISYPTDPWKDAKNWPGGYGQLTKIGMKQQYEFGQYLHKRYGALIPDNVSPNDSIYVQATGVNRTILSAEATIAGFFSSRTNNNSLWDTIPVHSLPEKMDHVLSGKKPCARHQNLYLNSLQSKTYQEWRSKYEWLYDYLEKNSGKSLERPIDVIIFHDTLKIHRLKGKTIPDWANAVFSEIKRITSFETKIFSGSREMLRLKCGFLIREIFERFANRTKGPLSPDRKIWMYSAHDGTLTNIMNALSLPVDLLPAYSASIFFEMYELNGEYYVQIFYRKTNKDNVLPLYIPGCGTRCSIDKLYQIYSPMIPKGNFETECELIK